MKHYTGYTIEETFQSKDSGVYNAFKKEALERFGLKFNHHMELQKRKPEHCNVNINGELFFAFESSYQSEVAGYTFILYDDKIVATEQYFKGSFPKVFVIRNEQDMEYFWNNN